ncbi:MAG: hypothetical protein Kow00109_13860 [Acidobacteriota bacterium]
MNTCQPRNRLILAVSGLLFSTAAFAADYASRIGVGLEGIGGRGLEFVDAAKTSRPWEAIGGGPADVDEHGWPLEDARTVFFDLRPTMAWAPPMDDPDAFQIDVSGWYRLSCLGKATVSPSWGLPFHVVNQSYDAATNITTADVYLPPGQALLALDFTGTQGGVKHVRLIRPGYERDTTRTFTREFLAALEPFRVLRFMDFTHTNNNSPLHRGTEDARNWTHWSDRKLPDDATQMPWGAKKDGASWEYVIELANASGKDIWINIPVAADDDYIRQLARLMKENLRPGIKIYLEYSNEVWNSLFSQQGWNEAQARLERESLTLPGETYSSVTPKLGARRVARRTVEIGRIFAEEFGEGSLLRNLFPVVSWWFIRPGEYRDQLQYIAQKFGPPSQYIYGIAVAPYFNSAAAGPQASPEQILDALAQDSAGQVAGRQAIIDIAAEFGVKALCYEGGPDSGANVVSEPNHPEENVANRIRAHRHPRIGDLIYTDMKDHWFDLGGDLFMFFTLSSAYSRWGMWGLTEDIRRTDTPKVQAIRRLIALSPPETAAALIFPQFVDGELAGLPNRTRIILRNNSGTTATGRLVLLSAAGTTSEEVPYEIAPWSPWEWLSPGTGALRSGVIEIRPDAEASGRLEGTEVFEVLGHFVSVPAAEVGRTHQLFVSWNSSEDTGVALYNSASDDPVLVEVRLADENGTVVATRLLELGPRQQLLGFVDDLVFFADHFAGRSAPFRGTLNLRSTTDQGIAVLGLLQRRDTGALIAVAPGTTVLP